MRRYLVFGHNHFDSRGGFGDLCAEFDTEQECNEFTYGWPSDGWFEIVDTLSRKIKRVEFGGTENIRFSVDEKYGRNKTRRE